MDKQDCIQLFNAMHPGFFEQAYIRTLPEKYVFDEMILSLKEFDPHRYGKKLEDTVSFGFYESDLEGLKRAVEKVDEDWPRYFNERSRVFCGYVDGEIASFCILEDLGTHTVGGRAVKVGGPGCVGTLPEYRDRGIGLTMVAHATQCLKKEGFDYSYIHYTYVAPWYEKLGYAVCLQWNCRGIK